MVPSPTPLEWVLRSKWHFITSLGLFFVVFLIYCVWNNLPKPNESTFADSFVMAYQVMISRMNVSLTASKHQFIVLMARHVGNLHLGFVAAHFLMFMNRK